tara:strand:+ start:542 stop:1201 length:660 start_codon:yes stop_codon:yes gene_type:complete
MNKKFKCVLFDLDGTLIDSGPDLLDALNHTLSKNNLDQLDHEVIGNLVGGGAEAMIRKGYDHLGEKINTEKIPNLINSFLDFYSNNCSKKTQLYVNVYDVLKFLKKKKVLIGLCTNKKQFLAEKILKNLKISVFFDYILGSNEKFLLKPDIAMPQECIKKLGVKAGQTIFVGDSLNDIIPANKLGMESVFVSYGYGKIDAKTKPKYNFNDIKEIKKFNF